MKIFLYYIGRPKDPHANGLARDFVERSSHYARVEMREIRPGRDDLWTKHPSARKILLDPTGKQVDSLADLIERAQLESRDLVFAIGGHDGFPAGWKERADLLLALSRMTWPHELARAMLAEQIYRAFTILRGHPYPR